MEEPAQWRCATHNVCMLLNANVADWKALDETPIKDKTYRRYAAGVDKVLSLFETALEEWADYISFLNKLLKVCFASRAIPI